MTDQDRRMRNMELIRKSRKALEETELKPRSGSAAAPAAQSGPEEDQEMTIMYRGKAIKRPGRGMKVPGVASKASKRGRSASGRGGSGSSSAGGSQDIKASLESLAELYREKLISKPEYDRKRYEILKRL